MLELEFAIESTVKMNATEKAIDYKNQCLQIVHRYIDASKGTFTEHELLQDCQFITRAHFEDIIEERACTDVCGYVLCDNVLSKKSQVRFKTSQIYRIKNNKVYDITRRKCFCCDLCFKSAQHLKIQINTQPIYMRNCSTPVLRLYTDKDGLAGDEIKVNVVTCDNIKEETKPTNGETKAKSSKASVNEEIVMKDKTKGSILRIERLTENKLSSPYVKEETFKELKDKFRNLQIHEKNVLSDTSDFKTNSSLEKHRLEYIRLCAKLNEEEVEDRKFDELVLQQNSSKQKKNSKRHQSCSNDQPK